MSPFDASQEGRLKALRSTLPTTSPEVDAPGRGRAPANVVVHDRSIRGCRHATYFDGNDPTGGIHVDALGPDRRERSRENSPRVRPYTTGSLTQQLSPPGSAKAPARCWVGSGKIWEPNNRSSGTGGRDFEPQRAGKADSDGVLGVARWAPDDFRRRHLGEVFLSDDGHVREAEADTCDIGDRVVLTGRKGRLHHGETADIAGFHWGADASKNRKGVGHTASGAGHADFAQGEGEVARCSIGAQRQAGGTSVGIEAEAPRQRIDGCGRPREAGRALERHEPCSEQSCVPAEALHSTAIASATPGHRECRPQSISNLGPRMAGQAAVKDEMAWRALQRDRELKGQKR